MNHFVESDDAIGRHADALKLNEKTLRLHKAKLGPDHPETLASMNNLASCYAALGRHAGWVLTGTDDAPPGATGTGIGTSLNFT